VLEKLKRLIREPLVHFLLIGSGIYGFYGIYAGGDIIENERKVTVTAGDIQALADQWTRLWRRPPTGDELGGVIRDHVRVKILHREAVAMGLDAGDTVIERRLAQKVELLAKSLITPADPTDETLKAWYAENPDSFKQPDLYSITHIFFDPDKREDATLDDAWVALAQLKALDQALPNYNDYGDRFMLQNYYPNRSELDLRKLFGSGFVDKVTRLAPGVWHGPVLSGYGTHLVMVNEVVRRPPPAYEAVKSQIKEQWIAGQVDELSDRFIDNLIARYEIVVEEIEVPITAPVTGAKL